MHGLIVFMIGVVGISLSGVMAPGPMTTATLVAGTRNRHAGASLAVGHGIVEFPLMFLILAGLGRIFDIPSVKISIGLVGGFFLAFLGWQMLKDARKKLHLATQHQTRGALLTGILMTAGNPYFLAWWATVGLTLVVKASAFGLLTFSLFGVVHWLCDLVWLEILSLASYKGSTLLAERNQRILLAICGGAMLFFAGMFFWDAGLKLLHG